MKICLILYNTRTNLSISLFNAYAKCFARQNLYFTREVYCQFQSYQCWQAFNNPHALFARNVALPKSYLRLHHPLHTSEQRSSGGSQANSAPANDRMPWHLGADQIGSYEGSLISPRKAPCLNSVVSPRHLRFGLHRDIVPSGERVNAKKRTKVYASLQRVLVSLYERLRLRRRIARL